MSRPGSTAATRVRKVRPGRVFDEDDILTSEEPMEIRLMIPSAEGVRPMSLSVTMRTPGNDFELAAGFLLTEGIIQGRKDIEQIAYCVDPDVEQEFNIVSVSLRPGTSFDPALVERHADDLESPQPRVEVGHRRLQGRAGVDRARTAGRRPNSLRQPGDRNSPPQGDPWLPACGRAPLSLSGHPCRATPAHPAAP